ncbi:MAG: hypothetical protein JSW10_03770 [Pseudomonadota bacterium]|nr:MAG: hypothetical protein JSW10_03770 [Pseudomonadota bacterium]
MSLSRVSVGRAQRGAALVTGLILLVALTLVGLAATSSNSLEQRMAANMADYNQAFNAAETVMRVMQRELDRPGLAPQGVSDCSGQPAPCALNPKVLVDLYGTDWWLHPTVNHTWWDANGIAYNEVTGDSLKSQGLVNTEPHYVAEFQSDVKDSARLGHGGDGYTYYYRVTARGSGATDAAQAIIQSTAAKREN